MSTDQVTGGVVQGIDPVELEEWYDSLESVLHRYGPERTRQLLVQLRERAYIRGVTMPFTATPVETPGVAISLAAVSCPHGRPFVERRPRRRLGILDTGCLSALVRASDFEIPSSFWFRHSGFVILVSSFWFRHSSC